MAGLLLLRLPADPADPVTWLACEAGREVAHGADALAEGAALAAGRRIVAIVPGTSVLLTRVAVPSRKTQHIRRAIPFALEERLAADVSGLHFAHGPRDADGTVPVAVVERALLDTWLADLGGAGLVPDALLAEPLALPLPESGWLLALDGDRALLRTGRYAGYALDRESVAVMLRGAVAETDDVASTLLVCGADPGSLGDAVDAFDSVRNADAADVAQLLAAGCAEPPVLDLLQGDYAREPENGGSWRDWHRPFALAACLLVLLFGERLWRVQQLESESARLDAQMRAVLRDSVPGITRVVDPVAQLRQHLAARRGPGGSTGFLDLLAASGEVLAVEQGWQLAGLSYREGTLQLQLRMPSFDHFERLRGHFATRAGLATEIGSLGSVEGGVRGSVTLRESDT